MIIFRMLFILMADDLNIKFMRITRFTSERASYIYPNLRNLRSLKRYIDLPDYVARVGKTAKQSVIMDPLIK